jgi:soluble lytic murein transglycosylase
VNYYEAHQRSVPFLTLLAKAAARGGEFQTSVGAYLKIHELIPNRRLGREALFQAAFMSYQFQDYDGAMRRFERFIEKYSKSGLARDARWHLAWVRYLRGDYEGAYEHFALQNATRAKTKRRHQRPPPRDDRTVYWMAMSLAKMGKLSDAKKLFESLEKPDPSSYYALAAKVRRNQLPSPQSEGVPLRDPAQTDLNPQPEAQPAGTAVEAPSESESEDTMSLNEDEMPVAGETADNGEDETAAIDLSDDGPVDSDDDEKIEVTDFKDPRLRRRFEIAQELISIGQLDWARHELYEVERRTRNPAFLKALVKAYESIQSYHRAVSISDTFFAAERIQGGFSGAKGVWETAYPRAFRSYVEKYAFQFSLPTEIVWSIMRAESHFKPDVLSPVGAKGLMQVMPETGRQVSRLLGDEELFQPMSLLNPETNIRLGSRYLLRLSTKLKNSLPLVAAAYNAGPHRVENWLSQFGYLEMDEFIEHIPFLETRNYVKKVTRNFGVYRGLYSSEKKDLTWLAAAVPVQVDGRPAAREIWEN